MTDLAGLDKNAVFGGSLSGCWNGGASGDGSVLSELSFPESQSKETLPQTWIKSLITSRRHFILRQNGTVELCDWEHDRLETWASRAGKTSVAAR